MKFMVQLQILKKRMNKKIINQLINSVSKEVITVYYTLPGKRHSQSVEMASCCL